ncbi:MAG: hypothetical protein E5W91_29185 [Mesorhizobium sp.]|uniref:hypothetical protein n=1 Tax=Mesorhizobium sp. TaxID=1871066 RepID=UPI001215112C|nr:hypothetical protein [Mesorhizobium sp.]TIS53840.1 MAG: hypothetical protein E5W91_29185 [Mesorhizobium sp.]
MSNTVWIVIAVALVAIILVFVLGPRLGWFKLNLFGAGVEGGQNKGNARVEGSTAWRHVTAETSPGGDATVIDSEAKKGDVTARSGTKK